MKNINKNVFLWGVFDIIHEGHIKLFQEASKLGNLYVIVLPDRIVNRQILHNEEERRENILKVGHVKNVFIDALPVLGCFGLIKPDIFCFGYDQDAKWRERIENFIKTKFPSCEFVTMEKYSDIHSSDLRKNISAGK